MNKRTYGKVLLCGFLLFAMLCAALSSKSLDPLPESSLHPLSAQQSYHGETQILIEDEEVPLAEHPLNHTASSSIFQYGIAMFAVTAGLIVFAANELYSRCQTK